MAEAVADVPGLAWVIGHRDAAALDKSPRAVWIPVRGTHRGPQQSGHNPRPIANRWVQWTVKCWGSDHDEAEAIMAAVVRGLHLTCTRGGYELGAEEWVEVGVASSGEAVLLTVSLGIPILDRAQPIARPLTVETPGALT